MDFVLVAALVTTGAWFLGVAMGGWGFKRELTGAGYRLERVPKSADHPAYWRVGVLVRDKEVAPELVEWMPATAYGDKIVTRGHGDPGGE